MEIRLDDKYVITTDENNFTLCQIKIKGTDSENAGDEYFVSVGYYGNLKSALSGYLKYSLKKDSETVKSIDDLFKRLDEIETNILKLNKE
jgi:hypothetical protein